MVLGTVGFGTVMLILVVSAGFELLKKPRWYITTPIARTAIRTINAITIPTALLLSFVPGEFVTIVSAIRNI